MSMTIDNLLRNSGLPGPRGNLSLMYSFSKTATEKEINECFSFYKDDLSNSPEEFVMMCAITAFCVRNSEKRSFVFNRIRKYASHGSWRIREAVAMGIQEIAENRMDEIIAQLQPWINGNAFEKRATVAALCEPKLLKDKQIAAKVLEILYEITIFFKTTGIKLSEEETSLRKALGYGWSVAIVHNPDKGKPLFEKISKIDNKHIRWIVKENLKKNRLAVMDRGWVDRMSSAVR